MSTDLDSILTDDRIAAMREHVLDAIDAPDVPATPLARRHRTALWLGSAATFLLVVVVGLGVLGSAGFGGGTQESVVAPNAAAPAPYAAAPTGGTAGGRGAAGAAAPTTGDDAAREVITTGSATVTVDDPRAAAARLAAWADGAGGRVDNRRESGIDAPTASLTVRVPSDRVGDAVDELKRTGTVESLQLSHNDVTSAAQDLDARIRALQTSVDRLTAILGTARTSEQVITAEAELSKRQQELESLRSRRAALTDRVTLSTLTITLQRPAARPDGAGGPGSSLVQGWRSLTASGGWLLRTAALLLPWVVTLVVLGGAVWVIRRIRRRR